MNEQEKIELFGPIYALCPDKFKFTVGDKMWQNLWQRWNTLLILSKVILYVVILPIYAKHVHYHLYPYSDHTQPTKESARTPTSKPKSQSSNGEAEAGVRSQNPIVLD
jgi:hypothetical protein